MNHSEWAQAVKERDECCQECGTTDNLHAHHIKPRALGGKNTLENGITFCAKHHRARHVGELAPNAIASKGRPKSVVKGISAPKRMWDMVDAVAERRMLPRSNVIRIVVNAYIEKHTDGKLSPGTARAIRMLQL